jgi:hypothetical protein
VHKSKFWYYRDRNLDSKFTEIVETPCAMENINPKCTEILGSTCAMGIINSKFTEIL